MEWSDDQVSVVLTIPRGRLESWVDACSEQPVGLPIGELFMWLAGIKLPPDHVPVSITEQLEVELNRALAPFLTGKGWPVGKEDEVG